MIAKDTIGMKKEHKVERGGRGGKESDDVMDVMVGTLPIHSCPA